MSVVMNLAGHAQRCTACGCETCSYQPVIHGAPENVRPVVILEDAYYRDGTENDHINVSSVWVFEVGVYAGDVLLANAKIIGSFLWSGFHAHETNGVSWTYEPKASVRFDLVRSLCEQWALRHHENLQKLTTSLSNRRKREALMLAIVQAEDALVESEAAQ